MGRARLALLTASAVVAVVGFPPARDAPASGSPGAVQVAPSLVGRWSELTGPPEAMRRTGTEVAVKTFNAAFVPDQVVAAGGMIWLVGRGPAGNTDSDRCRVGRLNPTTLALVTFALGSCGFNVTAGKGSLFLETAVAHVKSQTYAVHIERFSTFTHTSTVYRAVSATLFLGSDIAHTQLGYEAGSLWLYAQRTSPEVLRLSASSGAVEHDYASVPQTGGGEPLIAGTSGYVWLAGGAGTGADFVRVDLGDGATSTVRPGGHYASAYDMLGVGRQLYFLYLGGRTGSAAQALGSFIGHLSSDGTVLGRSPEEQAGTTLVEGSGQLFTVGPGLTCTAGLPVWRVDPGTLRTTMVTTLSPPGDPCDWDNGYRPAAAAAGSVFVLYSASSAAVLYRVTPP